MQNGFELNRPTIVALLYLGGLLTGILAIVGVVLAYVWKGDTHEPWEATHYEYAIRTFWFSILASIVGLITLGIGIGFLILLAVGVWVLARSVLSLVGAQKRAPMPNPKTLLF